MGSSGFCFKPESWRKGQTKLIAIPLSFHLHRVLKTLTSGLVLRILQILGAFSRPRSGSFHFQWSVVRIIMGSYSHVVSTLLLKGDCVEYDDYAGEGGKEENGEQNHGFNGEMLLIGVYATLLAIPFCFPFHCAVARCALSSLMLFFLVPLFSFLYYSAHLYKERCVLQFLRNSNAREYYRLSARDSHSPPFPPMKTDEMTKACDRLCHSVR